ncbi:MAG: hypothetical protein LC672_03080 [Acidobacteria bacterium]|nr:hypothetical protein [Acidobacteriota bacterium]
MKSARAFKENSQAREDASSGHGGPRREWSLTKEAFDKLLARMDPDAELAGEKYLLARRNLVRFFEGRSSGSAEEHADETINRVARRLDEGQEIHNLNGYLYGVARLVLLEVLGEREKEQKALREMSLRIVRSDPVETDETGQRLDCLTRCLNKLPDDGRELIVEYYEGEKRSKIENRQRLAEGLGIPLHALRSRAVRLREKLEACVSDCLRKKGATAAAAV